MDFDSLVTQLLEDEPRRGGTYFDTEIPYNFYALAYIFQTHTDLHGFAKEQLGVLLTEIKQRIIETYTHVVRNQIQKYIDKGRVVQPLTLEPTETLKSLDAKMKQTLRGDMKTRNARWEALTEALVELEASMTPDAIIRIADRIFNMTHNTANKIMDKFSNHPQLLAALDACSRIQNIRALRGRVSADVQAVIDAAESRAESKTLYEDATMPLADRERFNAVAPIAIYFGADVMFKAQAEKGFATLKKAGDPLVVDAESLDDVSDYQDAYNNLVVSIAEEYLPSFQPTHDYWGGRCFVTELSAHAPKGGTVLAGEQGWFAFYEDYDNLVTELLLSAPIKEDAGLSGLVDRIMDYESGNMDEEQVAEFFQELLDSGVISSLQGSYQRMAQQLIDAGLIAPKGSSHVGESKVSKTPQKLTEADQDIYDQVVALGVEIDHHESDLYIPVTPETQALIRSYPHRKNVKRFRSNIDGKTWFDIPFAYAPFWIKKQASSTPAPAPVAPQPAQEIPKADGSLDI